MTTRLSQTIEAIGLATSGELGSRFAPRLLIVTSPTTILRRTMSLPAQRSEAVSQLGIDDWSFRRGRRFGTMLVNLATHEIIELLPDRETGTAQAWMQAHPEIDVVSRDRGEEYAVAAGPRCPSSQTGSRSIPFDRQLERLRRRDPRPLPYGDQPSFDESARDGR